MPFLSFLTILPVLGFVYTICFIAREERTKLTDGTAPPAVSLLDFPARQFPFQGKRQIRWISASEFKSLSRQSENLILIALQGKAVTKTIPFPESHVLYIEPDRLIDLLQWLPPASGAVLYTSDRLSPTISAVRNLAGSAPIYIVCETS